MINFLIPIAFIIFPLTKFKKSWIPATETKISLTDITIPIGLGIAVILLWSIHSFRNAPLPERDQGVTYYQDIVYHMGNATELKNRFPPQNPRVSGSPLSYALGASLHMAMASRLTNIELSTITLRLFPMELLFLWSLALFWLHAVSSLQSWL